MFLYPGLLRVLWVCYLFTRVQLFADPWAVACQAPLSMQFSRQEYWSGLPCSLPGNLPNPGIKPTSLMSPALAGGFFTTEPPGSPRKNIPKGLIKDIWEVPKQWGLRSQISEREGKYGEVSPVFPIRAFCGGHIHYTTLSKNVWECLLTLTSHAL